MSSDRPFYLETASKNDINTLTQIFSAAFEKDAHTQLKLVGRDPNSMEDSMAGAIEHWIDIKFTTTVIKAVEISTGTIMGWTCWGRKGYDTPSNALAVETAKQTSAERPKSRDQESNASDDPIERLEMITNNDMSRWMKKIMPLGTKCMFLCAIAVHPHYQSRGIGSALIRWGTEKADADGVFCWVHASDGGHLAFQKTGFKEVERLKVDLDEFATNSRNGEVEKWGNCVFRYMVREPQSS